MFFKNRWLGFLRTSETVLADLFYWNGYYVAMHARKVQAVWLLSVVVCAVRRCLCLGLPLPALPPPFPPAFQYRSTARSLPFHCLPTASHHLSSLPSHRSSHHHPSSPPSPTAPPSGVGLRAERCGLRNRPDQALGHQGLGASTALSRCFRCLFARACRQHSAALCCSLLRCVQRDSLNCC